MHSRAQDRGADVSQAVDAAMSIASGLGLAVDAAVLLNESNRLAVRLKPCDVVARVTRSGVEVAKFEVELARRLAETDSPIAGLDPRVAPAVYESDGFAVTLWTYYESVTARPISPEDYADALRRLHSGICNVDFGAPHFSDRVAEAQGIVASRELSPALSDPDRELIADTLRGRLNAIRDRGAREQLLHGEPHPGNLLNTRHGPLFIDLETCCRGPLEFDLAHVPESVSDRYPNVDQALLRECQALVLAMVAAWRWDVDDRFPNGERAGRQLISALRQGPPWPALDVVMGVVSREGLEPSTS